jgi:NAD-dependent dihydropyrimidine dehydrogenase PreA subunit
MHGLPVVLGHIGGDVEIHDVAADSRRWHQRRRGAFADVCPTRALHIGDSEGDEGELVLADYYCIKCGACVQICPLKPEVEEYEFTFESQGVTKTILRQRVTNMEVLPIWVERWRIRHEPVQSGAWIEALTRMADDKASLVEIDSKRALKRHDLLKALLGHKVFER